MSSKTGLIRAEAAGYPAHGGQQAIWVWRLGTRMLCVDSAR